MSAHSLDTHRIVKRLQQAGFSDAQAETVTDVMREAREFDLASLATKNDIGLLRSELQADIVTLAREMSALRAEAAAAQSANLAEFATLTTKAELGALRSEVGGLRSEMASGFAAIRAEFRSEIAEAKATTKSEIAEAKADILKWVIGLVLVQGGIVVTLIKLIPGAGH